MMLCPRVVAGDLRQAQAGIALAPPAHRSGHTRDLVGIQLDQAGDHRGALRDMGQLPGQPIR